MFESLSRQKSMQSVILISPSMITPSPHQPRLNFSQDELIGLAQSIRENGILQPISVRKIGNVTYEIIAGERRLRAARLIGLTQVPCIVYDIDDAKAAVLTLLENLQREDLNFFEEADGIQKLISDWNVTQQEAATKLGKAQSTIANKLRLLRLSKNQRERIIKASLTERHARALLRLQSEIERETALDEIISKGLNVAETDRYVDHLLMPPLVVEPVMKQTVKMPFVRDVRLFINTISKAVDTMRQCGLDAKSTKSETDEYIEYIVQIPKHQSKITAQRRIAR